MTWQERIWLLQLLSRSLHLPSDVAMLQKRHVLQLVMSLHDSVLADAPTRRACLGVLASAARVPEGANALLVDLGAAGWIAAASARQALTSHSGGASSAAASTAPFASLLLALEAPPL